MTIDNDSLFRVVFFFYLFNLPSFQSHQHLLLTLKTHRFPRKTRAFFSCNLRNTTTGGDVTEENLDVAGRFEGVRESVEEILITRTTMIQEGKKQLAFVEEIETDIYTISFPSFLHSWFYFRLSIRPSS